MPKISALTSLAQASVDTAADVLPIVDATAPATTKKVTVQAMVNAGLAAAAPQGGIFALTGALTVSGTSTLGITRVSGADNSSQFGVSGATRGVRFNTSSYGTAIEGVDNTLVGSYQPLNVIATTLGLYTTGGGNVQIGTGSNLTQFSVTHTASAVNYLQATGSTTGNEVRLSVQGADTNAGMWVTTKGTGVIRLETGGGEQVRVSHTAAAVNYLNLTGSATGNYVGFAAAGSDTNIGITYTVKGNVSHDFYANNGIQFRVNGSIANATNYFEFFGQAAGSSPLLRSYSPTDSNVNARYRTQGTGSHQFETGSSGNIGQLVAHTANSVNYGQFAGNSSGGYPSLRAAGSDTNIGFDFATQGAAPFRFYTSAFGAEQLRILSTASAVNYATITGSATGNAVTISGAGSDANIDFAIAPKGTGVLRFGTHSALAAETVTGYITIKDSAGNTRKLAVVS